MSMIEMRVPGNSPEEEVPGRCKTDEEAFQDAFWRYFWLQALGGDETLTSVTQPKMLAWKQT